MSKKKLPAYTTCTGVDSFDHFIWDLHDAAQDYDAAIRVKVIVLHVFRTLFRYY